MSLATPPGTPTGRMTPRNRSLFLERGLFRLCLSRLRRLVYAECLERGCPESEPASTDQSARTGSEGLPIMHFFAIAASSACGTWDARSRKARRRVADWSFARWPRSLPKGLYGSDAATTNPSEIGQSIGIGISQDANRLLRFCGRDSPFVSGPRSAQRIRETRLRRAGPR